MSQENVLDTFNAIVVSSKSRTVAPNTDLLKIGVVTDFIPTKGVKALLESKFEPIPIRTLFGRNERLTAEPLELILKQFLNYFETYGFGTPGQFDLEVTDGVILKTLYVRGISEDELGDLVRKLVYSNAPIKNPAAIAEIIKEYSIKFDFNLILNNEVRIHVYDPSVHVFRNGDEAVRYMLFRMTNDTLVIKNKRKIDEIKAGLIDPKFFDANAVILSEVFNRFKPLILAAKHLNRNAVNRIARLSKKNHKPVHEGFNKRFLALALAAIEDGSFKKFSASVSKLSVRDKFKILNLIEYKKLGKKVDSFIVRNGTVHVEQNRPVLDPQALDQVTNLLLEGLRMDLSGLMSKEILLDANVDYGLPISRKQVLGNLPFGTLIDGGKEISSGVHWRNEWGATDLDLSTVDMKGNRTGWGYSSGYDKTNDVVFSGDMTYADNGAMEFMTSKKSTYGLFVNVFSGRPDAEFELVIGNGSKNHWITNVKVRERSKFTGKGNVIGFVRNNQFVVYQGKLNDRIANFSEGSPVLNRALAPVWTVSRLLDALGVGYHTEAQADVEYDFNLSYSGFSIDKLESLLYI